MGCVSSKYEEENLKLREWVRRLEEEIREARVRREQENLEYEHCVVLLATKEAEWKKEWRRCTEEITSLRRRLEEEEGRRKATEAAAAASGGGQWLRHQQLDARSLVEHMRAEQERREEAAEKWKRLYHAIKIELDDLILRTRQGEMVFWGREEVIESLRRELKAREETVESLRSRLAAVEAESSKREREVDILRQSLRILSNAKRSCTQ